MSVFIRVSVVKFTCCAYVKSVKEIGGNLSAGVCSVIFINNAVIE